MRWELYILGLNVTSAIIVVVDSFLLRRKLRKAGLIT